MASNSKSIAWGWVVEALADFNEANTFLLRDMVETIPGLKIIYSETAEKRIALRYLEDCSNLVKRNVPNTSNSGLPLTSGLVRRIAAAPKYVEPLGRYLEKRATSCELDNSRTESCGHDHPFINHKKATLQESSLYLLKESVLQGKCQITLSLREPSGLFRHLHCNSAGEYEIVKNCNDGAFQSPNRSSVDPAPDSGNILLQDDPSGSQQHLADLDPSPGSGNIHLQDDPSGSWQHLPDQNVSACSIGQLLEKGSPPQPPDMITISNAEIESPRQPPGMNTVSEKGSTPQPSGVSSAAPSNSTGEYEIVMNRNDDGFQSPNRSSVDPAPDSGNIFLQDDPSGSQQHLAGQDPSPGSGNIHLQDNPSGSWQHLPDQNASACSSGQLLEKGSTPQPPDMITISSDESETPRQPLGMNIISEKGSTPQPSVVSSAAPSKHRKLKKRHRRYTNPILPFGRRTKLLWTTEEEIFLKNAMPKFDLNSDGSIPWTKIMEFGCHVFHKTRQPIDLKDKWRNLVRKEGSKMRET